jgi:uncharacterized SAM-binding protein YcdF (DUF218 family)
MSNELKQRRWVRAGLSVISAGALGVGAVAIWVDRFGLNDRARSAGAIVVLGARVLDGGIPSPTLRTRVEHAVSLYHAGLASKLLVSGGIGDFPPAEAQVGRDLAVSLGVPADACLLEADSHNTAQNAANSARLLKAQGIQEVIVVSDPYHLLRAVQLFERQGIRAYPSPALNAPRHTDLLTRTIWTVRESLALWTHPSLLWSALRAR